MPTYSGPRPVAPLTCPSPAIHHGIDHGVSTALPGSAPECLLTVVVDQSPRSPAPHPPFIKASITVLVQRYLLATVAKDLERNVGKLIVICFADNIDPADPVTLYCLFMPLLREGVLLCTFRSIGQYVCLLHNCATYNLRTLFPRSLKLGR